MRLLLSLLLCIFSVSLLQAQDNPFISRDSSETEQTRDVRQTRYPPVIQRFLSGLASVQHTLNSKMSQLTKSIKEEKNPGTILALIGFCLAYGILHALGPGHGKTIMFSYVLSNPMKLKGGILLGVFAAFFHAISAIVFVSIVYVILQLSYFGTFAGQKRLMGLVSYGLITLLGVFLFIRALRRASKPHGDDDHQSHHLEKNVSGGVLKLLPVALLVGLVPCEGALFVLVFTISMDIYYLGILLVVIIGFGMAITIGATGAVTIGLKKGLMRISSGRLRTIRIIESVFEIGGGGLLVLFGSLLFLANL